MDPEYEAHLELGEWWRRPPYAIRTEIYTPYRGEGLRPINAKTNVLVSTGKQQPIRYDPAEQAQQLLTVLLDVAQQKAKPVEFANRFGLLGYNYLVPEQNKCSGGDPLPWFMAHVYTVYVLATLTTRIRDAKEQQRTEKLRQYLAKDIPLGPYALGGQVTNIYLRTGSTKPVLAALGILRYLLNANLDGTGYQLRLTGHGLNNFFSFRCLSQVIYWQLANQIGKGSIHRCLECGRVFSCSNPRTKFCLTAPGKKSSTCGSRYNMRKQRKRLKHSRRKKRWVKK